MRGGVEDDSGYLVEKKTKTNHSECETKNGRRRRKMGSGWQALYGSQCSNYFEVNSLRFRLSSISAALASPSVQSPPWLLCNKGHMSLKFPSAMPLVTRRTGHVESFARPLEVSTDMSFVCLPVLITWCCTVHLSRSGSISGISPPSRKRKVPPVCCPVRGGSFLSSSGTVHISYPSTRTTALQFSMLDLFYAALNTKTKNTSFPIDDPFNVHMRKIHRSAMDRAWTIEVNIPCGF